MHLKSPINGILVLEKMSSKINVQRSVGNREKSPRGHQKKITLFQRTGNFGKILKKFRLKILLIIEKKICKSRD